MALQGGEDGQGSLQPGDGSVRRNFEEEHGDLQPVHLHQDLVDPSGATRRKQPREEKPGRRRGGKFHDGSWRLLSCARVQSGFGAGQVTIASVPCSLSSLPSVTNRSCVARWRQRNTHSTLALRLHPRVVDLCAPEGVPTTHVSAPKLWGEGEQPGVGIMVVPSSRGRRCGCLPRGTDRWHSCFGS